MHTLARTQVRMPRELMNWLKQQAKEHNRSMNGELVALLQKQQKASS